MTALYPNVPDVPGVPVVNRAPATILTAANGAMQSRLHSQEGLDLLGLLDTVGASAAFAAGGLRAQAALSLIDPIFAEGTIPSGALAGAAGMATGAVNAIGRGDIAAAVVAGQQAVNYATEAIAALEVAVNPPGEPVLPDSGAQEQADIAQQWGIYGQDGNLVAPADNMIALEAVLDAQISDYPVENGGFASYNKVITPFDIRVVMSRGGSVEERQEFIKAVHDAWQSNDLYLVITPEVVYLDVNVVAVRRVVESDRGVGLTTLEVSLRRVRQTARLAFTSTAEAASAGVSNNGAVQAQPDFFYTGTVS